MISARLHTIYTLKFYVTLPPAELFLIGDIMTLKTLLQNSNKAAVTNAISISIFNNICIFTGIA